MLLAREFDLAPDKSFVALVEQLASTPARGSENDARRRGTLTRGAGTPTSIGNRKRARFGGRTGRRAAVEERPRLWPS